MLACGAALFLAGNVIVRWQLRIAPVRQRILAAVAALATIPVGVYAGLVAQLGLVAAVLIGSLAAESRAPGNAAGQPAGGVPAGPGGAG